MAKSEDLKYIDDLIKLKNQNTLLQKKLEEKDELVDRAFFIVSAQLDLIPNGITPKEMIKKTLISKGMEFLFKVLGKTLNEITPEQFSELVKVKQIKFMKKELFNLK